MIPISLVLLLFNGAVDIVKGAPWFPYKYFWWIVPIELGVYLILFAGITLIGKWWMEWVMR